MLLYVKAGEELNISDICKDDYVKYAVSKLYKDVIKVDEDGVVTTLNPGSALVDINDEYGNLKRTVMIRVLGDDYYD